MRGGERKIRPPKTENGATELQVADLEFEVVRKETKNLYIGVYPPCGHVRIAAPLGTNDEAIRLAVATRLAWIHRKRAQFGEQLTQTKRQLVSGETHYVWGKPYRLRLLENETRRGAELRGHRWLELYVPPGSDREAREQHLRAWYRDELKAAIPALIEKWARVLEVPKPDWAVKLMKTKWGTCKSDRKVWLNLELVKRPRKCLEYIVVHEMIHLLERTHTLRFYSLLDQFLPDWPKLRDELNRMPLPAEAGKTSFRVAQAPEPFDAGK